MEWLIGKLGKRVATYLMIALAIVVFLAVLGVVTRCTSDRAERQLGAQTEQGNRSATATANAAANAVEKVIERQGDDADIDTAVAVAKEEIGNAQNSDDIHAAVVRAWCMRDANRSDPACKL